MNKVLKVHVEDMDVVVQPGLKREELNEYPTAWPNPLAVLHSHAQPVFIVPPCSYLKQYNLFFPLDPGPSASLGGMVGTSCSGTHAVRYGTMKENILRYSSLAHHVYIAFADI
jgi:D-lactate dehydrogenase (cytochrome)